VTAGEDAAVEGGAFDVRVKLTIPDNLVRQPLIAQLVRRFDVTPNIRRASVEPHVGWMVCEMTGPGDAVERALSWLVSLGIQVDRLSDVVES
jgi:hypothetical protein